MVQTATVPVARSVVDSTDASVEVRPYRTADRPELVEMYEAYDDSHRTLGTPPRGRDGIVTWLDDLTTAGTNWVAVTDSTIVGHVVVVGVERVRVALARGGAGEHACAQRVPDRRLRGGGLPPERRRDGLPVHDGAG